MYAFIAIDRWYAAVKPIQYYQSQIKRNQKQILAIFLFCVLICLPFYVFPTIDHVSKKCEFPVDLMHKLTLLDAIFYSYLPFIVTLVFSILTLVILFKSGRLLKSLGKADHELTSSVHEANPKSIAKRKQRKLSKLKLTLMLLMFPLSYLVTTLPVFLIISAKLATMYFDTGQEKTMFDSEFAISKTLMFANNSFNILFLILLGKTLRNDMIKLLACGRLKRFHNSTFINNANTNNPRRDDTNRDCCEIEVLRPDNRTQW